MFYCMFVHIKCLLSYPFTPSTNYEIIYYGFLSMFFQKCLLNAQAIVVRNTKLVQHHVKGLKKFVIHGINEIKMQYMIIEGLYIIAENLEFILQMSYHIAISIRAWLISYKEHFLLLSLSQNIFPIKMFLLLYTLLT